MPNRVQRTCDKTVVVLMVLLLLMGLVTLFSATYYQKAATGDALAAVKKQLIGVALGAAGLRDAFTRAVSRFSASQSDAAFVGNERFAADSGDYSRRGREHQRFAKMAEFFRAEHAAV